MSLNVSRIGPDIYPDSKRVISRFFFANEKRAERIIEKVLQMDEEETNSVLFPVLRRFSNKYRSVTSVYKKHYKRVKYIVDRINKNDSVSERKKILIGAYFTMEYSVESAALFNPSIVKDPDQTGLNPGQVRVIISLRATGEGHISSIVFRHAIISANGEITLKKPGTHVAEAEIIKNHNYNKDTFINKLKQMGSKPKIYRPVLDRLPDQFNYDELRDALNAEEIKEGGLPPETIHVINEIWWLADSYTEIKFSLDTDLAERIIFPISKYEKNGIEDARFVKFTKDNGAIVYYGLYTAYDGSTILPKLIETNDFYKFRLFPLHGSEATDKNMALFPRKINGKYAMISRVDGFSNYIMYSDNLNFWNNKQLLEQPLYPWELVQMGNGGSPIETDRGWLMITHGVGPVRQYCLSACLLDLEDPSRVIGRLKNPLMFPEEQESAGYVPNVIYTCGSFVHNNQLIIPYAKSDYSSSFASVDLNALLDELKRSKV